MKTKSILTKPATGLVLAILSAVLFAGCSSVPFDDGKYETAQLENSTYGYASLGIKEGQTEIWEDGMRTDGQEGSYEWWYTDAEFDDGTTIVVVFYTKDGFDVPGPAYPKATIDITLPDGSKILRSVNEAEGTAIRASKDSGDVKIGDCYLTYTGSGYDLLYTDEEVEYKVFMESALEMWRPDTGHWYFGDEKEDFFAWFVAQPSSRINGSLTIDGKTKELSGTGYHDHNWGNIAMNEVINHWYWGRAKVGDYDIIAVDIISEEETGFTRLPVFMIAKDGVILDDDQSRTVVVREDTEQHAVTEKFYDNHLTYIQESEDGTVYTVEMIRENDIVAASMLDSLPAFQKIAAHLIGANPTYIRSLGEVILTIEKDGETEVIEQEGLWEQMFFGSNEDAYIWN